MAVALTAFQRQKLGRLFSVLDVDNDGRVGQSDYVRRVEAFAQIRGWTTGSAEYVRNLQFALAEWQNLCESADVDDDRQITREEFLGYCEVFLDDRDAVRAYARGDVQLLFDAMDLDADGRITLDEYRDYLRVCGVDPEEAEPFFSHADLDRDGRITRAEMAHAFEEFLVSENPASGSNLMFGKLDPA
jgi:Ca2+-binding EF-hand superfamily protein